ncbi:MAG: leucyl aminopeptidase [Gammaproteobacteria bacterium]
MKIRFANEPVSGGLLAILVPPIGKWTGRVAELDRACAGQLSKACRVTRFQALAGEICEVLAPSGLEVSRVLIVGVGDASALTEQNTNESAGLICARLLSTGEAAITIDVTGAGEDANNPTAAAHIAFGVRLRAYRFDRYRTPETSKPLLGKVTIVSSAPRDAQRLFSRLDAVAEGVFLARDLVSEPPNVLYPKAFATQIKALGKLGIRVEVLGEKKLRQLGFGALLGVSQGSAYEPQVVICEYDGTRAAGGKRREPPVVLAGKGVTFDAGGISIKPSAGLETLKQDMGGAASIVGAMKTLAIRKARCHVVGILGLVENMPSGTAQRPGDVIRSLSGKTVEIINTDAEGRLVLCDILWYAQQRYRPKVLIDMATLTGAIAIALGEDYAGLFSNDDALATQLTQAGAVTGDRLWRYPMGDTYDRHLDSLIADVKNIGPDKGRSIIAAQFIKRFVQPGVTWAHIDFGMMVWAEQDTPLAPTGATGFGVRLLDRLIADHFEER